MLRPAVPSGKTHTGKLRPMRTPYRKPEVQKPTGSAGKNSRSLHSSSIVRHPVDLNVAPSLISGSSHFFSKRREFIKTGSTLAPAPLARPNQAPRPRTRATRSTPRRPAPGIHPGRPPWPHLQSEWESPPNPQLSGPSREGYPPPRMPLTLNVKNGKSDLALNATLNGGMMAFKTLY